MGPALRELGAEVSMSRTGCWWDNAAMDASFAALAKECIIALRVLDMLTPSFQAKSSEMSFSSLTSLSILFT